MFRHLQIPNARERLLVGLADTALRPLAWRRRRRPVDRVARVLLLRLERIGDLLMTLDAIALLRRLAPDAEVDLVVGSWNRELAALIPGLSRVETLDVPWLARDAAGMQWTHLVGHALGWRPRGYDLVINFEPDIRSNLLARLSGATRRAGYWTGGGGALLSDAIAYEPARHVRENADRLVRDAFGANGATEARTASRLAIPADARLRADAILPRVPARLIGVHPSGGRPSKQWHPDRFAESVRVLAERHGATIVLTGSAADRPLVDEVARRLDPARYVDVAGRVDLVTLAAVLARLDLLVTGDTGPMHLAAAVGTPVVALFGPSNPVRYGPAGDGHEVLRIDLPCSPCGLVRLPPVRCRNRVPECLDGIGVDAVVAAAERVLNRRSGAGRTTV
ncbi:MAG TPA: glycosyltransferase family 9 protein [Vicinamibacterales bacterium]|nr:glycosyltransferase family 9 protein [Vicinamibacterales bacterium]